MVTWPCHVTLAYSVPILPFTPLYTWVFEMRGEPFSYSRFSQYIVFYYKTHLEQTLLATFSLEKQNLILGYTWLKDHNLEVNWEKEEVFMTRCLPYCEGC